MLSSLFILNYEYLNEILGHHLTKNAFFKKKKASSYDNLTLKLPLHNKILDL